ncbi:MAG: sulfurtransferase TusA family protein [Candidatus Methylomirabilia bacterium]
MDAPALVVDCRDEICPGPVIKVSKILKSVAVNQVLEVRATDPGAVPDMEALAQQTGQHILGVLKEAEEVRILIRRLR